MNAAYKQSVCCHCHLTYDLSRWMPTPGSDFVQFTECSILMIWASKGLLIVSGGTFRGIDMISSYIYNQRCKNFITWLSRGHGGVMAGSDFGKRMPCCFKYILLWSCSLLVGQQSFCQYRTTHLLFTLIWEPSDLLEFARSHTVRV